MVLKTSEIFEISEVLVSGQKLNYVIGPRRESDWSNVYDQNGLSETIVSFTYLSPHDEIISH